MVQLMRRALVASPLAAAFAGCASPASLIPDNTDLAAGQGFVLFKMVVNAPTFHPANQMHAIVLLKEDPDSANSGVTVLLRTRAATRDTAVYSAALAPGRYRVSHATSTLHPVPGEKHFTFPLKHINGTFEVRAGEASLLGTLLVQPLEDRHYFFVYIKPEAELQETFESLFPAVAERNRGQQARSFMTLTPLPVETRSASDFKRLAVVANDPWQSARGDTCIGGKLGKGRWRKAGEDRWREVDTHSWRSVTVLRLCAQGLLAAGEEGLLRHSTDDGLTWRPLAAPDRGVFMALETFPNGRAIAVTRFYQRWRTYASDDLLAGLWRELDSAQWSQAFPFRIGHRVGVISERGAITYVDSQTLGVERLDGSGRVIAASAMPGGILVKQTSGFTIKYSISEDAGRTWRELALNAYVNNVAAKDGRTIYAIQPRRDNGVFDAYPAAFMVSRDGGATWVNAAWPAEVNAVRHLMLDAMDESLLVVADDGRLMRSKDEGATWLRES